MDSWKNCPICNVETELGCGGYNKCPSCRGIWSKSDLLEILRDRNESKRLSAVRALVLEYGAAESPAIEALAAVWPEAVEGVR